MSESSVDPYREVSGLNALEAAEHRAFERGQESAKLRATVESHERRLNAINGSIDRSNREIRMVTDTLTKLGEDFRSSIAVAAARAEDARNAAERQVTARQFYVGLAGAVATVGLLLAGTGHV